MGNLELFIEQNKNLIESVNIRPEGLEIILKLEVVRNNSLFCKVLREINKICADWLGYARHSFLVPSVEYQIKCNRAEIERLQTEYAQLTGKPQLETQAHIAEKVLEPKATEVKDPAAVSESSPGQLEPHQETPIHAKVEPQLETPAAPTAPDPPATEPQPAQLDPKLQEAPAKTEAAKENLPTEAEETEKCFERLRAYFSILKTPPLEIASDISFLLRHSFNKSQIAVKVGASKPSISKYAAIAEEKTSELTPKNEAVKGPEVTEVLTNE
jgi:hypothetical protein